MTEMEFKISSGLKNIIGKELITNDLIAIFELVKNSYDAKAKKVKVVFEDLKGKEPKILIIDSGTGMSKDDIENKFLFVGYSEKKEGVPDYREKIQKHRPYAGAKGIGRFSCDRLGSMLHLVTKKKNEDKTHKLTVDWKQFEEDQKKTFELIKADYSYTQADVIGNYGLSSSQGTVLEISKLTDKWDGDSIIKLKRYLQRLINPAQVDTEGEFQILLEAKEFIEEDKKYTRKGEKWNVINGPIENFLFEKLKIKTTEVNSVISKDGSAITTEVKDKGEFIFRISDENPYPMLRDVSVKVFFLNTQAKASFKRSMGFDAIRYGSIFLYKNGIRIHPYGDEGDDWLGTEKRQAQGTRRFLSSRSLMGRVELFGLDDIKEVSSRDGGVIKNESFLQLYDYIWDKVLKPLERFVVEGLGWDSEINPKTEEEIYRDSLALIRKLTGQSKDSKVEFNRNLLSLLKKKEVEKIPEVVRNIELISEHILQPEAREYVKSQIKSLKGAIKLSAKETKDLSAELDLTKKESLFLAKAVSTDTEVVINLNHTIESSTATIRDSISEINKLIRAGKSIDEVVPFVDDISIENEKIKVLSDLVGFANFNTKFERIRKDLITYVKEYLGNVRSKKIGFRFQNGSLEYVTEFSPLEISILLDNFISNAKRAEAKILHVAFKVEKGRLKMLVADNGNGVPEKYKDNIFKRGVTTTKGSGIGLYHISQILKGMRGEVRFLGNAHLEQAKGACFEVTFNG